MRALSIRQPFASAILDGPKRVENRPRKIGLHKGRWVWVHASLGFYFCCPSCWAKWRTRIREHHWPQIPLHAEYPRGAILGAMLCGATYTLDEHQVEHPGDPWAHGPLCTHIEAVMTLAEPYPCKGALGLWTPPEGLFEQVAATDVVSQLNAEQYTSFTEQLNA